MEDPRGKVNSKSALKIQVAEAEKWLKIFDKNEIRELNRFKTKNMAAESLRPEMIAARREEAHRGREFVRICSHMTVTRSTPST
jgi:hypothetical protein